jgi:hypothetical protein
MKQDRYLLLPEVRTCHQCQGAGTVLDDVAADLYGYAIEEIPCQTCDGFGHIVQERKVASLLDLHNLLCDIRRENDKTEAKASQDTVM